MKALQSEGLGGYYEANRSGNFHKTMPNVLDPTKLAKYQVTAELYKQCFLKDPKLSSSQKEALVEAHPNRAALNEFLGNEESTE